MTIELTNIEMMELAGILGACTGGDLLQVYLKIADNLSDSEEKFADRMSDAIVKEHNLIALDKAIAESVE